MSTPSSSKRVTVNDVSKLAEVSTATISRVLNQPDKVSEETTSRVMAAIEELNYIPNSSARVLAGGKTNTIGLVIPEIGSRSLLPLLSGIEAGAQETGYHLLIYSTAKRTITGEELLKSLGSHNTDGLLIYVRSLNEKSLQRIHANGVPIVLLHQVPPKNLSVPYVTFQDKLAVKELVDHLIEVHSYKRIAFLRGPEGHDDSLSREMGYRESLKNHGIPFEENLVGYGGFNSRDAKETVASWIASGLDFDAIFCGDDMAALGAIQSIQEAGLKIPDDVAVAGFDDIDFGYNISPSLTTIRANFHEAGLQATDTLSKLINGNLVDSNFILPTKLIIRESCGC